MSKKDSTKTSLNFDLSQLSPAERRLDNAILKLSKTTKRKLKQVSQKNTQNKKANFNSSQMSPTAKMLEKRLLELSKTTKVRPTLVSQKQSPNSYQFVAGRKEQ
jgi:hypothetical protein